MDWLGFQFGFLLTLAVLFILLCAAAVVLWVLQLRESRRYRDVLSRFEERAGERPSSVVLPPSLPEPAMRYLRHAITDSAQPGDGIWLKYAGKFSFEPGGPVHEGEGGLLTNLDAGMVIATMGKRGLVRLAATEWLLAGEALRSVRLYNLFPLQSLPQHEAWRYLQPWLALSACWLPASLAAREGVEWSGHGNTLAVHVPWLDEQLVLLLGINATGALVSVRVRAWAPPRGGGAPRERILGLNASEELLLSGVAMPGRFVIGYDLDDDEQRDVLLDARVSDAKFL